VTSQTLFDSSVALAPLASWRVVAADNKAYRYENDEDTRDHKGHPPRLVRGKPILHQSLVHRRHDKVSDASAEVSKSTGKRISRANNILVKESSRPDLTGHKAASEDANEESKRVQTRRVEHGSSKEGWYGTGEQAASERQTRAEAITRWTCNKAHDQCGCKGNDVGVCDLVGFHVDIASDDVGEKGREGWVVLARVESGVHAVWRWCE